MQSSNRPPTGLASSPSPAPPQMAPLPARRPLMLSGRLWIGLIVTLCWIGMVGLLVRREVALKGRGLRQMGVSPEVLLVAWHGYEHWMWVTRAGERMGASMMSIQQRSDLSPTQRAQMQARGEEETPDERRRTTPGYLMNSRTRLAFRMLGLSLPIDLQTRVEMNHEFELQTLHAQALLAGQRLLLQGFVEGNDLYYRLRVAPQSVDFASTAPLQTTPPPPPAGNPAAALLIARDMTGRAPLEGPIVLGDVILPVLTNAGDLQAGQRWSTEASDPVLGQFNTRVDVRVVGLEPLTIGGKPIEAWHLREKAGEIESSVWYDEQGNLLRRQLPGGLEMIKADGREVVEDDGGFRQPQIFPLIDRDALKAAVSPELDGVPLKALLPEMPKL